MSAAHIPMKWSFINDAKALAIDQKSGAWSDFCATFIDPPEYASKAQMSWFKGCTFGALRTPNKSLRHDANVLEVFAVEGDYDAGTVSIDEAAAMLKAAGIEAFFYTTASHTPERPKWRAVSPLSKPCTPGERRHHVGVLNAALGGILATESFTLSQSYYYGRLAGAEYRTVHVEGEPLDTAGLFIEPVAPPEKDRHAGPLPEEPMTAGEISDFSERLSSAGPENFGVGTRMARFLPLIMACMHAERCGHPTVRDIFSDLVDRYATEEKQASWERTWATDTPKSHWRTIFDLVPEPLPTADGFDEVDLFEDTMRDLRTMAPDRIALEWAPRAAQLTDTEARTVLDAVHRLTGAGLRPLGTQLREAKVRHAGLLLQSGACGRRTIRHRPEMSAVQARELAGLIRERDPLAFVRHAGRPVRIASVVPLHSHSVDSDDAPEQVQVSEHSRATLVAAAEAVALYTVPAKGGPRCTGIPHPVIDQLIACDGGLVPDISGLVGWPLVTGGGEILATNGLHDRTGLVVHGCPENAALKPYSKAEAVAALAWLRLHYLYGFEFAGALDADAAIAGLFTAVQRPMLDMAPALAILAAAQSSGKTTLARRQHIVLTGRDAPLSNLPLGNDEELEKRLLALLLTAPAMITFDNVPDGMTLSMGPINAMLTAPILEGRILGATKTVRASTATAVVITGNNLRLGADETSRTLITRLAPASIRPEARTFAHADVVAHANGIRWEALAHVVGVVAGYLQSGGTVPTRTRFARWDVAVRQSLLWAGASDIADVFDRNADNAEHMGALRCMLRTLHDEFKSEKFAAREVINRLAFSGRDDFIDALEMLRCRDPQKVKSVGRVLAAQTDRPVSVDGRVFKLSGAKDRDGMAVYRVLSN